MKDVTVIGAGLGGLTSAALLAKHGKRVRVLERHFMAGGYATSFRRKTREMPRRAEFEVSLHLMGDLGEGGALRAVLSELGVLDQVEFLRADSLYRALLPGMDIQVQSYETYEQTLMLRYPKEQAGIRGLFARFIQLRQEMLLMMNKANRGEDSDIFSDAPTLFACSSLSLKQLLDEYIKSPELQSIIGQQWQYYGLPPSQISAAYYAYAWTEYMLYGGYYPKGRSQQISNALVQIIKDHGGEVLLRQEVTQIEVEGGAVRGVCTKKGYFPTESVISNADPRETFGRLIGHERLPRKYVRRLEALKPSLGCVQAYLLLDIEFQKVYGEQNHEIFVNEYFDLEQAYEDMLKERYDQMPFSITIYENLNSEYQMSGKTTLSLFILNPFDGWSGLDKQAYAAKKAEVTEVLLGRLERLYPNIRQHIDFVELSTPLTNRSYTGNWQGAIYGAQQSVEQSLHRRLPQTTPIQGLYLAGAWTRPGGGYSGVIWSGYNLAKQLLRNEEVVIQH